MDEIMVEIEKDVKQLFQGFEDATIRDNLSRMAGHVLFYHSLLTQLGLPEPVVVEGTNRLQAGVFTLATNVALDSSRKKKK